MKAIAAFLLVLCHLSISHGWTRPNTARTWNCREGPRLSNSQSIQQIDAGSGKVVARDSFSYPYFLIGSSWQRLSSIRMKHVSVGPAGTWACSTSNRVYKYVAGNFLLSSGLSMQQVDAGGDDHLVGVTSSNLAYCLKSSLASTYNGQGSLSWTYLGRRLKYYSCSLQYGCWGLDRTNNVYYTQTTNGTTCSFSGWRQVDRTSMRMIEVGSDGNVFAVGTNGRVYTRSGITNSRPYGSGWYQISMCTTVRHVSYDLGRLWVATTSGFTLQCT